MMIRIIRVPKLYNKYINRKNCYKIKFYCSIDCVKKCNEYYRVLKKQNISLTLFTSALHKFYKIINDQRF